MIAVALAVALAVAVAVFLAQIKLHTYIAIDISLQLISYMKNCNIV